MSRELWATYSVRDHLEARGLAADVLLFDRLVFPVPMTSGYGDPLEPDEQGAPSFRNAIRWARDPQEWDRWKKSKRNPEGQQRILKILDPVCRRISWDEAHQDRWRVESAKAAAHRVPDGAFKATRDVLIADLPAYVDGIDAIGPSYQSLNDIEHDLGVRQLDGRVDLPATALATVLGWE